MAMLTPNEKVKIIKDFNKSGVNAINFAPTRNVSCVSLKNWVKAYNKDGIEGLRTVYDKK